MKTHVQALQDMHMFQTHLSKLILISLLTLTLHAQELSYSYRVYTVTCPERTFTFPAISNADNSEQKFSELFKFFEADEVKKLLTVPCKNSEKGFFIEAQKNFHARCLELEKQFYRSIEEVSKDETVQMELTEALLNNKQHEGITKELDLYTKKMQAYCTLRDSLGSKNK